MSNSAAATAPATRSQFLLVAHDFTDPDALSRRLAARPAHLKGIEKMTAEGTFITGGAILSETEKVDGKPKMVGSMLLLKMESVEAVKAYAAQDPYVTGKVWEKYDIHPFRIAETGVQIQNL